MEQYLFLEVERGWRLVERYQIPFELVEGLGWRRVGGGFKEVSSRFLGLGGWGFVEVGSYLLDWSVKADVRFAKKRSDGSLNF